jgi:hypothetical protein
VRKNGPGPKGYTLKSALTALPCLEMEPPFPAHGALSSPISGYNATPSIFDTASRDDTFGNAETFFRPHFFSSSFILPRVVLSRGRFVSAVFGAASQPVEAAASYLTGAGRL